MNYYLSRIRHPHKCLLGPDDSPNAFRSWKLFDLNSSVRSVCMANAQIWLHISLTKCSLILLIIEQGLRFEFPSFLNIFQINLWYEYQHSTATTTTTEASHGQRTRTIRECDYTNESPVWCLWCRITCITTSQMSLAVIHRSIAVCARAPDSVIDWTTNHLKMNFSYDFFVWFRSDISAPI